MTVLAVAAGAGDLDSRKVIDVTSMSRHFSAACCLPAISSLAILFLQQPYFIDFIGSLQR